MWAQGGTRDTLNRIIRYYFDAKEDFRLAAGRSTDEPVRTELDKLVDERQSFHMCLQQELSRYGVEPSDNGTAAADFKRDWERLRGTLGGEGFEHALNLADHSDHHALEDIGTLLGRDLPPELRATLEQQADALRAARTRVHAFKPSTSTTP